MLFRFRPRTMPRHKLLIGGAWFFIAVSLAHLAWVIGGKWIDPAGTTKLYHAVVDGQSYNAWGLTYTGTFGLLTAIGQAVVVIAAATASVLPLSRTWRYRRAGHAILCLWSACWALNLIWLATLDHHWTTIAQAMLLSLLFACTGYRAMMGWSPGRSVRRSVEPPSGAPAPHEESDPTMDIAPDASLSSDTDEAPSSSRLDRMCAEITQVWLRTVATVQRIVRSQGMKDFARALRHRVAVILKQIGRVLHRLAGRVAPSA